MDIKSLFLFGKNVVDYTLEEPLYLDDKITRNPLQKSKSISKKKNPYNENLG